MVHACLNELSLKGNAVRKSQVKSWKAKSRYDLNSSLSQVGAVREKKGVKGVKNSP